MPALRGNTFTLLLVAPIAKPDDVESRARALYESLKGLGELTLRVGDGAQLAAAAQEGVDVVLLDLQVNDERICRVRLVP